MPKNPRFNAFNSIVDVVPLSVLYKCVFSAYRPIQDHEQIHFKLADDSIAILTKKKFLNRINLRVPTTTVFKNPSNEDV